jgi:carbon-monoxide dehydrogenase large subunit
MASGAAILEASEQVIEKGKVVASHALESAVADIQFSRGRFSIVGTDRGMDLMDLVAWMRTLKEVPPGMPTSLDVRHVFDQAPSAFPNGCHVAEVEIDPETGITQVVRYVAVNDFGTVVNPMLVAGQAHGGIVQGIGQALYESTVYDENGQLVSGSFTDYALPRADDVCGFATESRPVPARTNPLGAKGCGEAGCAGSLPAVMNAVVDALSGFGIRHIDMPATPEKVWRAINAAKAA